MNNYLDLSGRRTKKFMKEIQKKKNNEVEFISLYLWEQSNKIPVKIVLENPVKIKKVYLNNEKI